MYDEHEDDLTIEQAFESFYADLEARGVPHRRSAEPVGDAELFTILSDTYVEMPSA